MELIIKLATVFGLGMLELWAAVPTGLALKLHPATAGVTAAAGAITGALLVLFLGKHLRDWLMRRHDGKSKKGKQHGRINLIWQRYGVVGLGLLAPILTGAPLAVVLGLALGVRSSRLLFWISIGVVLWSAILTLIAVLGLAGMEALRH